MSMSAHTITGEYPLVTRQRSGSGHHAKPPPDNAGWLTSGTLVAALGLLGLVLLAVALVIIYWLAAHFTGEPAAGRIVLSMIATAVMATAFTAPLLVLVTRIIRRRVERAVAEAVAASSGGMDEMRRELAHCRADLRSVPEQVRTDSAKHWKVFADVLRQLDARLDAVERARDDETLGRTAALLEEVNARLGNLQQVLGDRLERIEQRQDELEEMVEDTVVVAEALGRARSNGHGNVHRLQPPGPGRPGK